MGREAGRANRARPAPINALRRRPPPGKVARVSLNPALEEARFCPRCGSEAEIAFPRSIACPACGYCAYYNPKAVVAVIPRDGDGRRWPLRRGFEPQAGRWTIPGGVVDLR